MKTIVLMFFAFLCAISSVDAQDFVQPVKRASVRIKKPKAEHKEKKGKRAEVKNFDYQHFKLSVNAGYSDHIHQEAEKIPTPITEYVKGLKSGSNFGLDFLYYPVELVGFGIKYIGYNGKSVKNVNTGSFVSSTIDRDFSVQFIGPGISCRYLHADMKNALYFNIAYGYADYRVNYQADTEFSAKGNTMATVYDLGYDFGLSQNVGVGFKVSYLTGILKEYKSTQEGNTQNIYLELGKYEKLHRLDFSIGLKLNL